MHVKCTTDSDTVLVELRLLLGIEDTHDGHILKKGVLI
jgi:hypothetical protein